MELSALFTDDARVAEAAAVAQKLSKLEFGFFPCYIGPCPVWMFILSQCKSSN